MTVTLGKVAYYYLVFGSDDQGMLLVLVQNALLYIVVHFVLDGFESMISSFA